MPNPTDNKPARSFWVIAILALIWNLIGVMTYLMSVTLGPEALAAMPEAERELYANIPVWATSAYAIAVFGGTLGCVLLLIRKAWAVPVLLVSLAAILLQMFHALVLSKMLEVRGAGAAVLPALIIVIAILLVWFSVAAKEKGWLT